MIAAADVGIMDGREEGLGGRVWGQTLASLAGQYPSANSVENLRYGPNDLPVEPAAHHFAAVVAMSLPEILCDARRERRLHAARHRAVPAMPLE